MVSGVGALALVCAAAPCMATVTITDCASDPHCEVKNKRTSIEVPNDTVVLAGAIVPKPGTDMVRVRAEVIVVDGAAGGSVTVTGKGKALELDATGSVIVTGDLLSSDANANIEITAVQMVKVEGPVDVESGGDIDIQCTGDNCPIVLTNAHFKSNRFLVDADGSIIWDGNFVELFSPRDLFKMRARNGSVKKSSAMTSVLAAGHVLRFDSARGVDAVSEAQAFCESCQIFSPSPTPMETSVVPTPTHTVTPTGDPTPTHTPTPPPTATPSPTTPFETASLPIGTPSPTSTPSPTKTTTPTQTTTATLTPTATRTATPTGIPTPTVTPTPTNCNDVIGGVESTLFIDADGDIDLSCTKIHVSENISIKATGNVDLTNATLDNTSGKCGEIIINGAQINIQGATIIDDDCLSPGDVSEMNGREQVPHTGFANVVGTPLVDD